jgi:signal transduction histidine kinase
MDAAQRNRTRIETAVLWLRKSAHELQAPLLIIRNLASGDATRGRPRDRLQKIAAAAEDGLILYERMLLNTRYKRAAVEDPERLSLADCLHEALRTAGVGLPAPEIRLRIQDFPVRGSRPLVVNAIRNVIRNGIEAVSRAGKGDIEIWTEADPAGCILVIRDTGEGMPEAVRRKVFRPGFTGAHGFGFGLAFTRATLEGLGGEATCRAAPGQYSEFRLWFPQSR